MNHEPLPMDKALAQRIMNVVPYKDRLPAGRLKPPVGMLQGNVRSLREVYLFLTPDAQSLPGINLTALADWTERTIGDVKLAHDIREAIQNAGSYVESCIKIYSLVEQRLEQAQSVLAL
jgi:hypothetical protein